MPKWLETIYSVLFHAVAIMGLILVIVLGSWLIHYVWSAIS
jgi:hypothetical protein